MLGVGQDVVGGAVGKGEDVELVGGLVGILLDCVELSGPPVLIEMEISVIDERGGGRVCTYARGLRVVADVVEVVLSVPDLGPGLLLKMNERELEVLPVGRGTVTFDGGPVGMLPLGPVPVEVGTVIFDVGSVSGG